MVEVIEFSVVNDAIRTTLYLVIAIAVCTWKYFSNCVNLHRSCHIVKSLNYFDNDCSLKNGTEKMNV